VLIVILVFKLDATNALEVNVLEDSLTQILGNAGRSTGSGTAPFTFRLSTSETGADAWLSTR
jgi:hypothetical protein